VIGNPISGGGAAREKIERLGARLQTRGHAVETFLTAAAGDGGRRAGELASGEFDRLVVVGGDGTLNEVVNGLPAPGVVPIAQLPAGTANILAHELGFPFDPLGAAALVERGEVRSIDLGIVDGKRFLMVVSAGFDAMVTRYLRENRRGTLGYMGYVRPVVEVFRNYVPPDLWVAVDDYPPVRCGFAVISNTRNYGGLFAVADRARCDSGHLDVCCFTRATIPKLLGIFARALTVGASRTPGLRYLTGRRIVLSVRGRAPVEVDGDYHGEAPVEIELLPGPVVVPPTA